MKKRILAILISAAMVVTMLPSYAFAEANAGAAADEGKQMKRWREIAGLDDESDE